MGLAHGAFCVGCCWSLMLVMFGVGISSLTAMLVARRRDRHREEPAAGSAAHPPARRRARPRGRVRGRRVSGGSYARRVLDPTSDRRPNSRRAPRSGDRRHPRRDPRRGTRLPARRRLRQPLDPPRGGGGRGPAQPDPLPLRLEAPAHPGGPRGGERAPAGTAARDVRRAGTAVGPLGARLRLPRRRPRVRLRPDPPGDDRRRLVRSGGRGRGPRHDRRVAPACWRTSRDASRNAAPTSAGSRRTRSGP